MKNCIGMADMAWTVKCREEDMKQRELENERRKIDDARRAVNEKAEQLKAISSISALIAGFAMVVQTNVQIEDSLNVWVLCLLGLTTALVVGFMLVAMLNATIILIAIYKYDTVTRVESFEEFWNKKCHEEWHVAFEAFCIGIPLFLVMLSIVGWVVFWNHPARNSAASIVSVVGIVTLFTWVFLSSKWKDALQAASHIRYSYGHLSSPGTRNDPGHGQGYNEGEEEICVCEEEEDGNTHTRPPVVAPTSLSAKR